MTPPARLTLEEAALASGLSYGRVYRRVVKHRLVPSVLEDGRWTIAAEDVALLKPFEATVDTRPGCTIKTNQEEWDRWAEIAAARGKTVSQWLVELARAVAGDGRKPAGRRSK